MKWFVYNKAKKSVGSDLEFESEFEANKYISNNYPEDANGVQDVVAEPCITNWDI